MSGRDAGRDVEQLFLQNQEREQALRTLLKTRPSESRDVQALRGEVRAGYSEILGLDPEFCASKDVELLLWKNCYYKRIEDFRKRLRKYAHLAASLERAKAYEAREHLHVICQAFGRFLGEATEFYSSLLRRFEAMQHQYASQAVGSSERRARLVRLVILSTNRCFIFLGDLARYRELHGENSVKDWSSAERFYHQALAVLPTSGNPHNQLAVLATYTDAECVSVYRYCRSLMIESPFQTAHENLTLLFEKNKLKGFGMPATGTEGGKEGGGSARNLGAPGGPGVSTSGTQHHGKGKGKGSGGRGNTGALLKSFLRRFVRLHGMIFSGRSEDLEDFPSIFETAITDFRTLLSNSAFGDALLLKMVVICIFSVTHVADANPASNGSSLSDPRDESFSNSGSAADGGSSLDGASNAGSTGTQAGRTDAAAAAATRAEEVRRNARLSYPLALAFGVSAQIGRHVRTQEPTHPSQGAGHGSGHGRGHHRHGSHGSHGGGGDLVQGHHHHHHHQQQQHQQQQHPSPPAPVLVYGVDSRSRPSSNQPQPRPLGSRLLGPVVLFCDWLTARSKFLCLAEEERSSGGAGGGGGGGRGPPVSRRGVASVAVQEAEMRGQFWEVVQRLSATLPEQDPSNQADAFPADPLARRRPLKEHVELRGFLPLADLYKKRYAMDGPAVPAVPDDCAGSVRIRGLKAFAAAVSGESFTPMPPLHHDVDLVMMGSIRDRSEYSGRSDISGGSGSHMMHDNRPFDLALRQQAPRSQYSRAPPGMGGGGGSGNLAGPSGERVHRSSSGPGPMGSGYFGSGSSLGGGSEQGGRRSSRVATQGAPGGPQHSRNASVGAPRGPVQQQQQQQHLPSQVSHVRHHSQSLMPPPATGSGSAGGTGDLDQSGQYLHPPLHRVHSQATGVTTGQQQGPGSLSRIYSSRHSDTSSRHSLDSGMRYYDSRPAPPIGGPSSYNPASMASNEGSGSGSSGVGSALGSAHDTRSFGAWSAPGGRSGGGVGSGGGGGGSWAADHDQRSSFRSDPGSGDEEEVAVFTPNFGGAPPHRRRTTGGGGGPVAIGRSRDNAVGSGARAEDVGGRGGSDLGSAGSPQLGSGGSGSGLIGGGIWTGTFQPQDLALSPQAPSDHNEDGERYASEHSLFGSKSWRGALGSVGGHGNTPVGTPATASLDASVGTRVTSPRPSSPSTLCNMGGSGSMTGSGSGSGLGSGGDSSQQPLHDHGRTRSLDHRASASVDGGGMGYLNHPFQASPQQQNYPPQQQQQQQQSYNPPPTHSRQASTGSMRTSRTSPPSSSYDHRNTLEPPGFSGGIPGSPNTAAPRMGSGNTARQWPGDGAFQADSSPVQRGETPRRSSLPGPPPASSRSHHAAPGYPPHGQATQQQQQQRQQSAQASPPLKPQRQRHEQQLYGRRSSSPGASSRGGNAPGDGGYASGGSPLPGSAASQRSPPSVLPHAFSSGLGGGGGGGSSLANNHDDASSIFGSNVSGHSTYSGFSGLSAFNAFGGSELSSVGGGRDGSALGSGSGALGSGSGALGSGSGSALGSGGGGGNTSVVSAALPWRTPPTGSRKGDPNALDEGSSSGLREGRSTGAYAPAHGSTGGALGWGAVMSGAEGAAAGGGTGREDTQS